MEDYLSRGMESVGLGGSAAADAEGAPPAPAAADSTWENVMPLLAAAADEMKLGDLLAGQSFDLQDAMSALEMMDPQMDTGMRVAAQDRDAPEEPIPTLPDEPSAPLVIGLLDEVMCAEHGWYRGLSLLQTVYAIEWMQSAHKVVHLPLRATLVATARAVAAARAVVLRGDIHEEEDFNSTLSGLNLHDAVSDQELVGMLNDAEAHCAAAVRAAKQQQPGAPSAAAASGSGSGSADAPPALPAAAAAAKVADAKGEGEGEAGAADALALAEAVLSRVRFRRAFVGTLMQLARPSAKAIEACKKMLAFAEAQLATIEATIGLGTPRGELAHCLCGRAVRKTLGSAPAKKVEWLERTEGLRASRALLGELRAICAVTEAAEDYDGLIRWLDDLTGAVRPAPCVLTRSAVQLLAITEDRGCGRAPQADATHAPPRQTPRTRPPGRRHVRACRGQTRA